MEHLAIGVPDEELVAASDQEVADLEFVSQARHYVAAPVWEIGLGKMVVVDWTSELEVGIVFRQVVRGEITTKFPNYTKAETEENKGKGG